MEKEEVWSVLEEKLDLEYWSLTEFAEDMIEIAPGEGVDRVDQVILVYERVNDIGEAGDSTMIETVESAIMLKDDGSIQITV